MKFLYIILIQSLVITTAYAQCNSTCETCDALDPTKCITCYTEQYRVFNALTDTCDCDTNYEDVGTDVCRDMNCNAACIDCPDGPDTCLDGANCATNFFEPITNYCMVN